MGIEKKRERSEGGEVEGTTVVAEARHPLSTATLKQHVSDKKIHVQQGE